MLSAAISAPGEQLKTIVSRNHTLTTVLCETKLGEMRKKEELELSIAKNKCIKIEHTKLELCPLPVCFAQAGKPEFEAKQKELQAVMNTETWTFAGHLHSALYRNDWEWRAALLVCREF